jgi:hypothetical protein
MALHPGDRLVAAPAPVRAAAGGSNAEQRRSTFGARPAGRGHRHRGGGQSREPGEEPFSSFMTALGPSKEVVLLDRAVQGSMSWARRLARARRSSRDTCICE